MIDFLDSDKDDRFTDREESTIGYGLGMLEVCLDLAHPTQNEDNEDHEDPPAKRGLEQKDDEEPEELPHSFFNALTKDPDYPKTRKAGFGMLCSIISNLIPRLHIERTVAQQEFMARGLVQESKVEIDDARHFAAEYIRRRDEEKDEELIEYEAMTSDGINKLFKFMLVCLMIRLNSETESDEERQAEIEERFEKAYEHAYPHIREVCQGMMVMIIQLTQICHEECKELGTLEKGDTEMVLETVGKMREAYAFDEEGSDEDAGNDGV